MIGIGEVEKHALCSWRMVEKQSESCPPGCHLEDGCPINLIVEVMGKKLVEMDRSWDT